MKDIRLLTVEISNFMGIKHFVLDTEDGSSVSINAMNAMGKSTVFNAVLWLFFGKNKSGEEKFGIRPVDEDGNRIHDVDIVVEGLIQADGKQFVLKKTSREKLVKKRGTETAQYSGNEILYEIDGYPRKESEYKAFIAELIPEDVFKILTNPLHFASLPWKQQRELLMRFVMDKSDADLAKEFGGFDLLIPELEKAPSLEEIKTKFSRIKKDLENRQKELPIRIDELNGQIVEGSEKNIRSQIESLDAEIAAEKEKDARKKDLEMQAVTAKGEILQYEASVRKQTTAKRAITQQMLDEAVKVFHDAEIASERKEAEIPGLKARVTMLKAEGDRLNVMLSEAENQKMAPFDENETICPNCGQKYPENRLAEIRERHEAETKSYNASRTLKIASIRASIAENDKNTVDAELTLSEAISASTQLLLRKQECEKTVTSVKNDLNNIEVEEPIFELDPEWKKLTEKYSKLDAAASAIRPDPDAVRMAEAEKRQFMNQLAMLSKNIEIRERIKSLQEELRLVSQKIADQERIMYLLEMFTRRKLETISDQVNSHFQKVNFVLFNRQENGGIQETCSISVDGVTWQNLNDSDRILAGLDVINSLQDLYGTEAFVFIDNSECINDFRIPKMRNQMILLRVTDDRSLRVEVI